MLCGGRAWMQGVGRGTGAVSQASSAQWELGDVGRFALRCQPTLRTRPVMVTLSVTAIITPGTDLHPLPQSVCPSPVLGCPRHRAVPTLALTAVPQRPGAEHRWVLSEPTSRSGMCSLPPPC